MSSPDSFPIFSNSVAGVYERLLVPLLFQPYAHEVARRLAGSEIGSLLEIAAGTGVVTRALAHALPATVSVTATDLSQPMLDQAQQVGTARPVRWQQADVMALPEAPESFDLVVCQFGVMFFQPKSAAFAEVHRVLRSGGRFMFSVWRGLDDNEFADVTMRAVNALMPAEPARFFERIPHGYYDEATIADDLRAGGFAGDAIFERIDHRSRAASAHDVATAYCGGTPLRVALEQLGPEALTEATDAAAGALEQRFGGVALDARMSALLVTVTK